MTIISILQKVRAPSRLLVHKGLIEDWVKRVGLDALDAADAGEGHRILFAIDIENDEGENHPPAGREENRIDLLHRSDNLPVGVQDRQTHALTLFQKTVHSFYLLQGAVFGGTLPQKSAGFWNSDDANNIAYMPLKVKSNWTNRKSPYFRAFSGVSYWIKNFSSPQFKTWFAPMFFPGSFAVLSGAASPPAFLAGVLLRRRRGGFALIQVSCTRKEIASQSSPPRGARRLARIVFSAQNGIRDFV